MNPIRGHQNVRALLLPRRACFFVEEARGDSARVLLEGREMPPGVKPMCTNAGVALLQ